MDPRRIKQSGRILITEFEGVRLQKYKDAAGNGTIGIGHLIKPDEIFPDSITQEQCDALFERDLAHAAGMIGHYVKVALTDNQFDALGSLVFNLGMAPLVHTLGEKLNVGDYAGAANEFLRWVFVGMQVLEGLVRRREAERTLFLTPDTLEDMS